MGRGVKASFLPFLVAAILLLAVGCSNALLDYVKKAATEAANPADPIVGLWKYTAAGSSGSLPQSKVISYYANGSFLSSSISGSSGSYTGGNSWGTWALSSGTYTMTNWSVPTSLTDPTPVISTATLSADHSTLSVVKTGASGSTQVFNKVAAPAAADPILGLWQYTATGSSGQLPESAAVSFKTDGSTMGSAIFGSPGNYAGVIYSGAWSVSSGNYTFTVYNAPTSSSDPTPTGAGTGTLSPDHTTFTLVNTGAYPQTMVYKKVGTPATDPILGLWKYTAAGSSGPYLPVSAVTSFDADGSAMSGAINGSPGNYAGSIYSVAWSVSSGNYTVTACNTPTSSSDATPITSTATLSADHTTLTVQTGTSSTAIYVRP
ncbi:MAG: hypothetical protein ABSG38_15890 [Spirochaetia bacterium]|jgi:hypothetical protein